MDRLHSIVHAKPNFLQELRLYNTRMTANMTHDLLDWLLEDVKISKLSLVNCNLSAMSLTHPEAEADDP